MLLKKHIKKVMCYLLLLVALTAICGNVNAQSIKTLEQDIDILRKKIELAEKMLESKGSQEQVNLRQISLLRTQIDNRKAIVANMDRQSAIMRRQINTNSKSITKLETEQQQLRDEYGKLMVIAYKNYLFNNSLLFLFSANDFNDLQIRIYYLKRYSDARFSLSQELDKRAEMIDKETDSLAVKRTNLEQALKATKAEIATLDSDNKRYNQALAAIRKDKNNLASQIRQNQTTIRNLQNKIREIVAEEARKERERLKRESEAKRMEHMAESTEFAKFKGKLPAPTSKGVIVERFGKHPHPVQRNLIVENKGINYEVPKRSEVTSVFNGIVTKIFFFQGLNNSVMVRHGEYFTTYSGLTKVDVEVGDNIKVGQTIGTIDSSNQILHFELWKGAVNQNPELWLKK